MKVLFLTHRLPYPPNRGDRLRAYHLIRTLSREMQVDLISLVHDRAELEGVQPLQELGLRVTPVPVPYYANRLSAAAALAGRTPLTHVLLDSPDIGAAIGRAANEKPDVVFAYCSGMAKFAVRPPLEELPLVLDLVDLDSNKWLDLSRESRFPLGWIYRREALRLGAFEQLAVARAGVSLVVNDRERDAVRRVCPGAHLQVLPNGVDLESLRPGSPPAPGQRVVFCGVMNYQPNEDGVRWFAREVWPRVRASCTTATFTIVGSNPAAAIRNLASPSSGIEVTGRVEDVKPHLWNAAVSVAPLHVARGIQNKVLEAVAAGLPTVVTPSVFEGLPDEVRAACRVAGNAEEFAAGTIALLRMTAADRRTLAGQAACQALSWDRQMAALPALVRDVARTPRRMRPPAAAS
jgi:sugar transferase (PEP-CTERM/EpsH1 system associated)